MDGSDILKKNKVKNLTTLIISSFIFLFAFSILCTNNKTVETSAQTTVSNKKIEWGIKRGKDHAQPDLGSENKRIIDEYEGISMGNSEKPYVYLTFDCGYEAGYTEKILEVLKQNEVKAIFFITGHYLNSASDMVKKMIDEGHIIREPHIRSHLYARIN